MTTPITPISSKALFEIAVRRFSKRPSDAARIGRLFVENRVWEPGTGGWGVVGQTVNAVEQGTDYLLAVLAGRTTTDCVEALKVYRDLVANDDDDPRTLHQWLTELIVRALTREGRERLRRERVNVWVTRTRPRARLTVGDRTVEFFDLYERRRTRQQTKDEARGLDLHIIATITEETIIDFGIALGAEQHDAPPVAAGGASEVSDRPRANAAKPTIHKGQDTDLGERKQRSRAGRSPHRNQTPDPSAGEDEHDGRRPDSAPEAAA